MAEISGRAGAVYSSTSTVVIDDTADDWTTDNATTSATDADIPTGQTGTSVKIIVPELGATQLLAHEPTGGVNLSAMDVVYLWAQFLANGTTALAAGDVALLLDNAADCQTPEKILSLPAMATSGLWVRMILDVGDASGLTATASVGIRQVADLSTYSLFVKDIRGLGFIDGIKSWTLNYSLDVHDTTDFTNGQATNSPRVFTAGLSGWSGTFEGFKDGVPVGLGFGSTITLALSESQTAGQSWLGDAIIMGIDPNTPVDDAVTYTYTFQGTGELIEATA